MTLVFTKEADLCAAFIEALASETGQGGQEWTAYPESAGFDILLARKSDGAQIGVEAKLALNVKVINQALPRYRRIIDAPGPDYRAVLVPSDKVQAGLASICHYLGITVIAFAGKKHAYSYRSYSPWLPSERNGFGNHDWHEWCPASRCKVPDYIPDVVAGDAAPVALTEWKVKAIRLAILLESRPVTRVDFKALGIDPSRWTDRYTGWLEPTPNGYVPREDRMPDFRKQHPVNYEQIKADRAVWMKTHNLRETLA